MSLEYNPESALAAISIVRELAAGGSPHDHEYGECLLCEKTSQGDPTEPTDHDPDCPWRRAVEWTEAYP